MWRLAVALLAVILAPAPGLGQQSPGIWSYLFAAPGLASPEKTGTVHLGAGMGGILNRKWSNNIGTSWELGYLAPTRSFGDGRGFFSIDGSYLLYNTKKANRFAPFVELGYTRAFGPGSGNLLNYGAGVNYWIRPQSGLQVGVRDHFHPGGPARHITEFRIAWVFVGFFFPTV